MTNRQGFRPLLTALTVLLAVAAAPTSSTARPAAPGEQTRPGSRIVVPGADAVHHGGPRLGLSKAAGDSFNIYGGVRADGSNDRLPEGQFQDFILFPREQGWTGIDLTEQPSFWNISTFNAENLDATTGNRAMWSGVPAGTPGYQNAPGYGNNWNDSLLWSAQVNPTINTDVRLSFTFNYDLEPGYDFFLVEYDSAGAWVPMATFTGSNKNEQNEFVSAVAFDETVTFTPLMYTGPDGTDIRLRLRVFSDVAYSDEDGLYVSRGAAQVDNIEVRFNDTVVSTEGDDGLATFESLAPGVDDTEGWTPVAGDFAGDFAKVLIQLRDIDPCRQNLSPMLSFIDDGTPPANAPTETTGGSLSPNWTYGVVGGYTVNYTGGISNGLVPVSNEWWSPEIAWDDTTTTEDDGLRGGAVVRFTVWQHLPLPNGIFWTWRVRSLSDGDWSSWRDRGFVYYGDGGGSYLNTQFDVTDLLQVDPDKVQLALGMADLAEAFGFPGTDATPSPAFDNVSVWRYDSPGPSFAAREIELFNDGFPNIGSIDLSDPAALSVRMDMALDVNPVGNSIVPGDSIVVDAKASIPGTTLQSEPVLRWVLEANPFFDTFRQVPADAVDMGPGARGWTRYMGTVEGDSARTAGGVAVQDKFFFDLPHDGPANANASHQTAEPAMFYPGDVIRYFVEATDTQGNVASIPADTTGFLGNQREYSRVFTIRALPTITSAQGDQPDILVVNDFGHRGGENDFLTAFGQLGMKEGVDFDTWTTKGPSSLVSNGIGSGGAHGATGQQLLGYSTLMYLSGNLSEGLISDGSNENGNDKSLDTEALSQWHNAAGDRYMVYFGDDLVDFMNSSGPVNASYLATVMGVQAVDTNLRDEAGGLTTPLVQPADFGLTRGLETPILAFGGCLGINQFDSIQPAGASDVLYEIIDPATGAVQSPPGGVWYERLVPGNGGDDRKVDVTFPFGFNVVYNPPNYVAQGGVSARALFLQELLTSLGGPVGDTSQATDTDAAPRPFRVAGNSPNPFNPKTTIAFTAPRSGDVRIRVFNLRGELVRTLLDGTVEAGEHSVVWNGTDERGSRVASGVYLYRVEGFGRTVTRKMAMVK